MKPPASLWTKSVWKWLAALLLLCTVARAHAATPSAIPLLNWPAQRSDWVNVKTDVIPAAKGDGTTDDTNAIQKGLDLLASGFDTGKKGLYFPPGNYKISRTLTAVEKYGILLVGHGRATRLFWTGAAGGTMFRDDGLRNGRYIGLVWDGMNRADSGVHHFATTTFNIFILHLDEEFRNFKFAGLDLTGDNGQATADVAVRNCLFRGNESGSDIADYNDLAIVFDACLFLDNNTGIAGEQGDFHAYNCHFERSRNADIVPTTFACSVRRCTSVGSAMFLWTGGHASRTGMVIEDCCVDGWQEINGGAIGVGGGGPFTIFDCTFTHPPSPDPPIVLNNWGSFTMRVVSSANTSAATGGVYRPGANSEIVEIAGRKHSPIITSASTCFFRDTDTETVPSGKLFDAKANFGAAGDGIADDTTPVQNCINAARKAGGGAVAYLPSGRYKITRTLDVSGGNYYVEGSGVTSSLPWSGDGVGPVMQVTDPQNIRIQYLSVGGGNCMGIRQVSVSGGASRVRYDWLYGRYSLTDDGSPPDLELNGLPAGANVLVKTLMGDLNVVNSSSALILLKTLFEYGRVSVSNPARKPVTGFTGVEMMLGRVQVDDNQNLVVGDLYTESMPYVLQVWGNGNTTASGRVTIQGQKMQGTANVAQEIVNINNYRGRVFLGTNHSWLTGAPPLTQTGSQPCDLIVCGAAFDFQPVFNVTAACRKIVFCNSLPTVPPDYHEGTLVPEAFPPGWMTPVAAALDDLTLLGQLDFRFARY